MMRFPVVKAWLIPPDQEARMQKVRSLIVNQEAIPWSRGYELPLDGKLAMAEVERTDDHKLMLSMFVGKDVAHLVFDKLTSSCVTSGTEFEEIDIKLADGWAWKIFLPYGSTAVHLGCGRYAKLPSKK